MSHCAKVKARKAAQRRSARYVRRQLVRLKMQWLKQWPAAWQFFVASQASPWLELPARVEDFRMLVFPRSRRGGVP